MKNILTILLCVIAFNAFTQTQSISVPKENIKSFQVSEMSFTFITPQEIMSGLSIADTIVIDGDTILTDFPDSLIINFPQNFYDSYNGNVTLNIEDISGETALSISKVIAYGSQCNACKFTKISEDSSAPYDFTVPNIRLRLVIIATSGTGRISTQTTLKAN